MFEHMMGFLGRNIDDTRRFDSPGIMSVEGEGAGDGAGGGESDAAATGDEKKYTQADIDRAAAEARRKGEAAAARKAAEGQSKFKTDLLTEFDTRNAKNVEAAVKAALEAAKASMPANGTQTGTSAASGDGAGGTATPPAKPATGADNANGGDAGKGKHAADPNDPVIAEMRAKQHKLELELEKEREARKKLEGGLTEKDRQTEAAKAESRRASVFEDLVGHLVTDAKLPDKVARGAAKVMMAEDRIQITVDAKGHAKAYWKTGETDDEGNEKTLPLKDGVVAWGKTDEADQYRPAVIPGAGTRSNQQPFGAPRQTDMSKMTEQERWQYAEETDRAKRQQMRGQR